MKKRTTDTRKPVKTQTVKAEELSTVKGGTSRYVWDDDGLRNP